MCCQFNKANQGMKEKAIMEGRMSKPCPILNPESYKRHTNIFKYNEPSEY